MNDLVLIDVAAEKPDGSLEMKFRVLDKVLPFATGGNKQCFGNLFVGTVLLEWKGAGNPYQEGIANSEFRVRNLNASKYVAQQFLKRYPNVRVNWYITYESNLNYLENFVVKENYKKFLGNLIKELTLLRSGAVMWSPTFWDLWNSTSPSTKLRLGSNLQDLFQSLAKDSRPGITWMNLQDSVGKSAEGCFKMTPADAVKWYNFVKDLYPFPSMQMNVEQFKTLSDCKSLVENEPDVQIQREKYYASQGVNMGAAFEIRYWRERENTLR
ncbi:uncharacterized protein LOC110852294 isoform X2 [Folsomia candida]|nr:uncharacterized protein LOC110852294 isoform X2 [Folsomia candida]